jgi:hypothetical protein
VSERKIVQNENSKNIFIFLNVLPLVVIVFSMQDYFNSWLGSTVLQETVGGKLCICDIFTQRWEVLEWVTFKSAWCR